MVENRDTITISLGDNYLCWQFFSLDIDVDYMSQVPYSNAVGFLIYVMVCSCPDLAYAFGTTTDRVVSYVDSDFAGDLDNRRSLIGYIFSIGDCAITWKATLQATVALSITEAEYMTITKACKEAIWLKGLFGELSEDLQITTIYFSHEGSDVS
ncbi:secreted RxLR effector protein 161-like [Zingiber officinale]|uniref:secreted RxLR effector protein 161-like n=1 Tax=Zingiber officinale TaxID=94328 RepID=UPI001C4B7EDF|nr:secreted RxLR effector protein 161-like [Zingiber officinale]